MRKKKPKKKPGGTDVDDLCDQFLCWERGEGKEICEKIAESKSLRTFRRTSAASVSSLGGGRLWWMYL